MRSKLFVPGSRPELFPKALASAADVLSFDLEDSVTEPRKDEARAILRAFLLSDAAQVAQGKTVIVRVNALDTPHFAADVAAVTQPGLDLINVPKVETPEEQTATEAISKSTPGQVPAPGTSDTYQSVQQTQGR